MPPCQHQPHHVITHQTTFHAEWSTPDLSRNTIDKSHKPVAINGTGTADLPGLLSTNTIQPANDQHYNTCNAPHTTWPTSCINLTTHIIPLPLLVVYPGCNDKPAIFDKIAHATFEQLNYIQQYGSPMPAKPTDHHNTSWCKAKLTILHHQKMTMHPPLLPPPCLPATPHSQSITNPIEHLPHTKITNALLDPTFPAYAQLPNTLAM